MRVALTPAGDAVATLVRRQLALRRLVSVQRAAIRRALGHGETRGTLARLEDTLRQLQLELRDIDTLLRRGRVHQDFPTSLAHP